MSRSNQDLRDTDHTVINCLHNIYVSRLERAALPDVVVSRIEFAVQKLNIGPFMKMSRHNRHKWIATGLEQANRSQSCQRRTESLTLACDFTNLESKHLG